LALQDQIARGITRALQLAVAQIYAKSLICKTRRLTGSIFEADRQVGWPAAVDAAQRALRLDRNSAMAHAVLGLEGATYAYDWRRASSELDATLALKPRDPYPSLWPRGSRSISVAATPGARSTA
jgi:hypothetical protein